MKTLKNYAPPRHKMLWPEREPISLWQSIKDALFIIICILALLSVYSWKQMKDAEEKTIKYSALVAIAMNGGTLYDHNSDTAFFFDKPTEVKIK